MPLGATTQSNCTSNPTSGRIPRLNCRLKGYTHPYARSTTHNSQDMETNWMTIDRSLDKDVHMYSGKYSAIQNEIMPSAATWIQLEMIILSEVRDGDFPNSPVVNSAPSSVSAGKRIWYHVCVIRHKCTCGTESRTQDRLVVTGEGVLRLAGGSLYI